MKERWRFILGYEGYYKVSTHGRYKTVDRYVKGRNGYPRLIKGKMGKLTIWGGRIVVPLWKNNKCRSFYMHRLVLETFVGPCPEGMEACHFPDRDQTNCRLDNLRWDTRKENRIDADIHGTLCRGSRIAVSKLKEEDIPKIMTRLLNGEYIGDVADDYGVCGNTISDIKEGVTWFHITSKKDIDELSKRRRGAPKGLRNRQTVIPFSHIQSIRKLYENGDFSTVELAEIFGTSLQHLHRIIKYEVRINE